MQSILFRSDPFTAFLYIIGIYSEDVVGGVEYMEIKCSAGKNAAALGKTGIRICRKFSTRGIWNLVGMLNGNVYKINTVEILEAGGENVENFVETVNTRSIFAGFQHLQG